MLHGVPPLHQESFPEDRSNALLAYIGESDGAQQVEVSEFLEQQCQCELPVDEHGEVELDAYAQKLDDHMRKNSNGRYYPPVLTLHKPALDEETDDE